MEFQFCIETVVKPPRGGDWERTVARIAASPPERWCGATLPRIGPDAELLRKHRLDGGRLTWTGHPYSELKLAALEDFERHGSTVGSGLAMKSGFFWVVRKGGSGVVRLADGKSAKQLNACPVWPVGVATVGGKLSLEFVASSADSFWQILQCWRPVLYGWGIQDFQFELHDEGNAWEQLDVEAAFLYLGPEDIRELRAGDVATRKGYRPWRSRVCRVVGGVLAGCESGRSPHALH